MKKTVAHFIRKSTQLKASFIQNQILNHINYKPVVIYKYESEKDDGGYAEFNQNQFKVINLNNKSTFYGRKKYNFLKLITNKDSKLIQYFIKRNNVKILHFHYGTDAGIYSPFLKINKIPSVVSFYGYDCSSFPRIFFGYGKKYLQERVFKYATKILAMSLDMKNDLVNIGCPEEKIIIHYYGTDVTKFYYKERTFQKNCGISLLIVANLLPYKGHLFLLKSLLKVLDQINIKLELRIVGKGSLEDTLKKFVTENNLSSHVTFVGPLVYGTDEMTNEFKRADIYIHPSVKTENNVKEGIPGAIIEAMASGLPVISTYHAGIPYIIENNKTGLLVKEWDIESLAKNILKLINDEKLRKILGREAQKYAINNLDLKAKEIELEDIYDEIIRDFV